MGKKFTTLISTLTLAAGSLAATISPPHAFATGESEISLDNYWSFSEILELKTNLEAEAREKCGEDYECRVEYRGQQIRDRYQADSRYLLVAQIIDTKFQVTGINPTAETVTVYYNDENMEDWEFTREESHYYLKDMYLAWAEAGYPDMRNSQVSFNDGGRNRYGPIYVADANNGATTEKVHLVFAHRPSDGNPTDSWLEYGKENVLNVAGSNLADDTSHMLHFAAYAYEGYSVVGAVAYSNFAANYRPGMEYKLMYDKNNFYEYWVPQYVGSQESAEDPTEEPIDPTDEPAENPTEGPTKPAEDPISSEEPSSSPIETAKSADPTEPTSESTISAEPKTAFTISVNRISTSDLGVPAVSKVATESPVSTESREAEDTGTTTTAKIDDTVELPTSGFIDTQKNSEEEYIFPWWIIVFIFSGIFLTLWWFIPVKKYEKSIDK